MENITRLVLETKRADLLHSLQRAVRKMERRKRRMKKLTTPDDRNHEPVTSDPTAAMITEQREEGVKVNVST